MYTCNLETEAEGGFLGPDASAHLHFVFTAINPAD